VCKPALPPSTLSMACRLPAAAAPPGSVHAAAVHGNWPRHAGIESRPHLQSRMAPGCIGPSTGPATSFWQPQVACPPPLAQPPYGVHGVRDVVERRLMEDVFIQQRSHAVRSLRHSARAQARCQPGPCPLAGDGAGAQTHPHRGRLCQGYRCWPQSASQLLLQPPLLLQGCLGCTYEAGRQSPGGQPAERNVGSYHHMHPCAPAARQVPNDAAPSHPCLSTLACVSWRAGTACPACPAPHQLRAFLWALRLLARARRAAAAWRRWSEHSAAGRGWQYDAAGSWSTPRTPSGELPVSCL
jgi:hypothetical protein